MSAFDKGLCWALYKHMESSFVQFLEYVPYTYDNAIVSSPKLLALLLQICGYIDTVFKEMALFTDFAVIPECEAINKLASKDYAGYDIRIAQSAFEKIYKLSSNNGAKLVAKLDWVGDMQLTPFSTFAESKAVSPYWWGVHQKAKHRWTSAIHEANMYNTLEALSGAFLLNAVHYPSVKLLWRLRKLRTFEERMDGLLEETRIPEFVFDPQLAEAIKELKPLPYSHIIETQLFRYDKIQ